MQCVCLQHISVLLCLNEKAVPFKERTKHLLTLLRFKNAVFQLINFIGYVCERQVNETTLVGEKGGGKRQQTEAAPSRGVYMVL